MSIFKESFKDFVRKQIKIREAIISHGNKEGEAILIIAKYQYEYTFVLEKEICIAAMLKKLLEIC